MVIRREAGKYVLRTKDGRRVLGRHDTREEALAQERAIEHAKRERRGGKGGKKRGKAR